MPVARGYSRKYMAAWLAQSVLERVGDLPPWTLQALLAVSTVLLGLVVGHVGATAIMVPISINVAISVGGAPVAFALTMALSASNNLISTSNPVLAMVAGPGGYRMRDWMRVGLPLTALHLTVVLVVVNLFY